MVTENKVVKLNYILRENSPEGLIQENTYEGSPFEFIFGKANMIPGFEEGIANLNEGDKFAITIKSEDAYGAVNPGAIVDLDIDTFKVHDRIDYDMIKVGNSVPMQDSNGNKMDGLIIEVTDSNVKMDFNHPLAGKDLYFEGEISSIREATAEELSHGHVHGEKQHSHDNGGCGCGSGCGCH
jgi:FKBP-type peptidyl-prolyl cis-trans isomerase SlyD